MNKIIFCMCTCFYFVEYTVFSIYKKKKQCAMINAIYKEKLILDFFSLAEILIICVY